MRYLVYGAGAIGGLIGGLLTAAGHPVTVVTRGAHREAMAPRGLVIHERATGRTDTIRVNAVLPGEESGPYDVVYVTLKAHQIAASAEHIASLRARRMMSSISSSTVRMNQALAWGCSYWLAERRTVPDSRSKK